MNRKDQLNTDDKKRKKTLQMCRKGEQNKDNVKQMVTEIKITRKN